MNSGERNELLVCLTLIYLRDHDQPYEVSGLGRILTVGNTLGEFHTWPQNLDGPDLVERFSDDRLRQKAKEMGISKAGGRLKADVKVNGLGISLKSHQHAPPAIVNHTTRPGWEEACRQVGRPIARLDLMIEEYWKKRMSGEIKEDVCSTDPASPFALNREYLSPLLEYFLFTGTGTGPSRFPANVVLDIESPTRPGTWSVYAPSEIVNIIWPRLVFSVRSKKGMPAGYPNMRDHRKKLSVSKWTRLWQGAYRGALHVRVR